MYVIPLTLVLYVYVFVLFPFQLGVKFIVFAPLDTFSLLQFWASIGPNVTFVWPTDHCEPVLVHHASLLLKSQAYKFGFPFQLYLV